MMSGDNFTEEVSVPRAVLGDVTNRPVKRGFSLIAGEVRTESGEKFGKDAAFEDENSYFAKQVCLGVENLVKEKCKTSNEKGLFLLKDKKACDLSTKNEIGVSKENVASVNESTGTSYLLDGGVKLAKLGTATQSVPEVADASRDSAFSDSTPTSSEPCKKDGDDEGKVNSDTTESDPAGQGFVSLACTDSDDKDLGAAKLVSGKLGSFEGSNFPYSQGSKLFELERCTTLKGGGCTNLNGGADMLKACSCSFCLKAAYIWSDLHYQDIKGRISALRKSQKEASILVNKYVRGKQTDTHGQENSHRSVKLESDLVGRWRSLFHHMEEIFSHESNQLQTAFLTLNDLRENCKLNLERTTGMPPDTY